MNLRPRLLAAIISTLVLLGGNCVALPAGGKGSYTGENQDNTPVIRGEVSEQVTEGGSPDSGGPPSQEHPTVTASDPSMWDEQPQHKCMPQKDKYGRIEDKCYDPPSMPVVVLVRSRLRLVRPPPSSPPAQASPASPRAPRSSSPRPSSSTPTPPYATRPPPS